MEGGMRRSVPFEIPFLPANTDFGKLGPRYRCSEVLESQPVVSTRRALPSESAGDEY